MSPIVLVSLLLSPSHADDILFVNWGASSGQYSGSNIYQVLVDMGHTVDLIAAPSDGAMARNGPLMDAARPF